MSSQRVLCVAISLFAVGCSTLDTAKISKTMGFNSPEEVRREKYGEPVRVAVVWTPNMLTATGSPPTRGFAGRLFFYNNRNQPIPVDGELVVYGFDDTGSSETKRTADKRFGFSAEQFATHFKEGELGASYSVWVPWDHDLEKKQAVTLIPVFITNGGRKVHGQPTKLELAGRDDGLLRRPGQDAIRPGQATSSGVQQIQHTTPVNSGLSTTAIPLSVNMQRHLRSNAQQTTLQSLTPEAHRLLQQHELDLARQLAGANRGASNQANNGETPSANQFQLRNHFAVPPYDAGHFNSTAQFNSTANGATTDRPRGFRPVPQPRVPDFAPRLPQAQAWQRVRQASVDGR